MAIGTLLQFLDVDSLASPGDERIVLSAADTVAVKLPWLKHVIRPSEMEIVAGEGVTGTCVLTHEPLVTIGDNADRMTLDTVDGFRALTTVGGAGECAIALPAGSATESYTIVAAIRVGQSTHDGSASVVSTYFTTLAVDDTLLAVAARVHSINHAAYPDKLVTFGANAAAPAAVVAAPSPETWVILVVDWDNDRKIGGVGFNTHILTDAAMSAKNHAVTSGSYMAIGHPLQTTGVRSGDVGNVYVFGQSMRANSAALADLGDLVAAMMTDYDL